MSVALEDLLMPRRWPGALKSEQRPGNRLEGLLHPAMNKPSECPIPLNSEPLCDQEHQGPPDFV